MFEGGKHADVGCEQGESLRGCDRRWERLRCQAFVYLSFLFLKLPLECLWLRSTIACKGNEIW